MSEQHPDMLWVKYPNVWKEDPNTQNGEHWTCGFVPAYVPYSSLITAQEMARRWESSAKKVGEKLIEKHNLLKEILNSDMAQREEDEGRVCPLLQKIREACGS
jgi:hypothetical protein